MIKCGVLCVPAYEEEAVTAVRRMLVAHVPGLMVVADRYVSSQRFVVEEMLRHWCDEDELDLVFTLGGTLPAPGPASSEIVPEATLAVLERLMPGLPEAMRSYAQETVPFALLERGVAGLRGRTLIVNLPAGAAATIFLVAIVEVLAPALAYLRAEPAAPHLPLTPSSDRARRHTLSSDPSAASAPAAPPPSRGLDPTEFAEYLRRRKPSTL